MPRTPKEIDPDKVKTMASMGMNNRDIATLVDLNEGHMARRFEKELAEGRANLRQRLRLKQIEIAETGNPAMLIWLGKQYLEQSDKAEVKSENTTHVEFEQCDDAQLITRAKALLSCSNGSGAGTVLPLSPIGRGANGVSAKPSEN